MRNALWTLIAIVGLFTWGCGTSSPVAPDADHGLEAAEDCSTHDQQPC